MDFFNSIYRLCNASDIYDKVKKNYRNKELQEAIRLFIEPALDKYNYDYNVDSSSEISS